MNWTEDGTEVSTDAAYSFTATANRTLVANFIANTVSYTISASVNPINSGTITGTGDYNADETVTLTATANTGFTFINWTEDAIEVSTDAAYSFTATANRTLVANFQIIDGISGFSETNSTIVYPNPNTGQFDINFESGYFGVLSMKIYCIDGSIIKEFKVTKTTKKFLYNIDLGKVANGTYYIDITTSKEKVTKPIVIQ